MIQNEEFIQDFLDEAASHLKTLDASMFKLRQVPLSPETVNELFRAVHSIKGTAGFFELIPIVELARAMESIFKEIRNGKKNVNDEMIDALLAAGAYLRVLVNHVNTIEEYDHTPYMQRLANL